MKQKQGLLLIAENIWSKTLLKMLLQDQYLIYEANKIEDAAPLITSHASNISAVLLCLMMPALDAMKKISGFSIKEWSSNIPLILFIDSNEPKLQRMGFEFGAEEIICSPYEPYAIKKRIHIITEHYLQSQSLDFVIREQQHLLHSTNHSLIQALGVMTEYKHKESGAHMIRIGKLTKALLRTAQACHPDIHLMEDDILCISEAAILHDIGKISIPDSILDKPGKLTTQERAIMETHTNKGGEILKNISFPNAKYKKYCYEIAMFHHERFDGSGYPEKRKGDSIPIAAQFTALADCYDALVNTRSYKEAYNPSTALDMISHGECGAFSEPMLVCLKESQEAFISICNE